MTNMPNITQTEMAVVAAAVLLLFIAPALLSWSDERRRRRAQHATRLQEALQLVAAESAVPASDPLTAEPALFEAPQPLDIGVPPPSDVRAGAPRPLDPSPPLRAPAETDSVVAGSEPSAPAELLPLSGVARHHFRIDDLHQAQLSDWPPAAIRNDPERSRSRYEAEQAAEPYRVRMREAVIVSPYPARAHCLGAADADATELRFSFLLFPVVWPVSQNQAVAQAVFRIDRVTGTLRGWVDALRPQELSEDNRREIGEAGGEV
jgi:type II secretory pathway pseudopilin PulG